MDKPLGLLAELTYRCPLACPYCSNPVDLGGYSAELDTSEWFDTLAQARRLGVLQVHLSGGEPLVRDLVELVDRASRLGTYTNLVTSGVSLTGWRRRWPGPELDHVQLSVQAADAAGSDAIVGLVCFERKLAAATAVTALGLPLTLNVVLHRGNIDRIEEIINLGCGSAPTGSNSPTPSTTGGRCATGPLCCPDAGSSTRPSWWYALLGTGWPTGSIELVYVVADYNEGYPKPCIHGWGHRQLTVAPNGDVLPCPAAGQIPDLGVDDVRDRPRADIWAGSAAFTRFRGTDWLPQPCHSCPRKDIDYGGCRCQAYELTGDPAVTDPACRFSPHHHLVTAAVTGAIATVAAPTAVPPHPEVTAPWHR